MFPKVIATVFLSFNIFFCRLLAGDSLMKRDAPLWAHFVVSLSVTVSRGFSLVAMNFISFPTGVMRCISVTITMQCKF